MTRARNNSRKGLLTKWILGINLAFIFLLLLTYITPWIRVEKWGWLSLLALTYPFVSIINGLFAAGWLFFRNRYALLSLIALLVGWGHHSKYVHLLPGSEPKCAEPIQIMTYNMRGLSLVPAKKGASVETKINMLRDTLIGAGETPDILCIQEGTKGDLIAKAFGLKHSLHAPKSSLWLLSKYPVVKQGELDGAETSPSCMWADLKTPQGIIRVYNMHLVSNRVTNTAEELIEDMDLNNENTWQNIRFIVNRYRKTTKLRAQEARTISDHIHSSPHPVVVLGDGNDPPLSNTYHTLTKGLKDSFRKSGSGLSTTYASKVPLLRIDYILGTPEISFTHHITHKLNYSDHYPVSTDICLVTQP